MGIKADMKKEDKGDVPYRQIRALYDEDTITVYQAYSKAIAEAAVREQRLDASPQFKEGRMTWIKPSWGWMMYRSGYASKDARQTNILALKMRHSTFLSLLSQACVTHGKVPLTAEQRSKPVRVQWDPERAPSGEMLRYRSIQIGVPGTVVPEMIAGIVKIEDVSERATKLGELVNWGKGVEGGKVWTEEELLEKGLVVTEKVYELGEELRGAMGMDVLAG
ncbi:hypothetical protein B0O99DRAFT_711867 [Bisporella sp. PMI_857]|nr:hypothetical protein B0O99DRAFT_711867 [Bisporella sp. PMI_857]